ncbi:MAG: right-handed parallel beta-helix repeat-containing protein [Gemmataceae bacterium]
MLTAWMKQLQRKIAARRTHKGAPSLRDRTRRPLRAEVLEDRSVPAVTVVSPGSMANWQFVVTDVSGAAASLNPTAGGGFSTGPGSPPAGVGSAHLYTGNGTSGGDGSAQLRNLGYDGTLLSNITTLSYSTYASSWNGQQLPYLQLYIDLDGIAGWDDRLFYEPAYSRPNTGYPGLPDQGPVALNTWQTWDTLTGGWYSENGTPVNGLGNNGPGFPNAITFAEYVLAHPGAKIVNPSSTLGGVRFTTGFVSPSEVMDTNIDNVTIGVSGSPTTYDFEAAPPPSNVYVDDSWASGVDVGEDPDGAGPATAFGVDAFATIQGGVNAVAVGGTVNVRAGTYNEEVSVPKTVTLLGAQAGVDARTRGVVAESVVDGVGASFSIGASDVVIDGFTLQGQTFFYPGAAIWMQPGTSGTEVRNNIIQNNSTGIFVANNSASNQTVIEKNLFRDNTNSGPAGGHDIYADQYTAGVGMQNVLIDSNTFTNTGIVVDSWAVGMSNTDATPFTNITVSRNTITNHGRGMYFYNTDNSAVTDNTITGVTNYAVGFFSDDNTVSVTGNRMENGNRGVWIAQDFTNPSSAITINYNSLVNNTTSSVQVEAGSYTGTVNAMFNWWGTTDATAINASPIIVGTPVDFSPYLDSGTDTSVNPGFQPDLSVLDVTDLGAQAVVAANHIQEGIAVIASGGTLKVFTGTYPNAVDATPQTFTLTPFSTTTAGQVTLSSGGLTLDSGNTLKIDINGTSATDFDSFAITGNVDLGGATLNLISSAAYPLGTIFDIIVVSGGGNTLTGTFAGKPNASTIVAGATTFQIFYNPGFQGVRLVSLGAPTAPSTVYVNEDWSVVAEGATGFSTQFSGEIKGVNAFSDIADALSKVAPGGTVIITGTGANGPVNASYGAFTVSDATTQLRFVVDTDNNEGTVTLGGAVTLAATTNFQLFDDATYDPANLTLAAAGTIDGAQALTVSASTTGTGAVQLDGVIGGTTPVSSLTIGTTSNKVASLTVNEAHSAGAVNLAVAGAITESGSDSGADLTGTAFTITANGSGTSGNRLEIDATTLQFTSAGFDVYLEDTAGGLQVNDSSVGASNTIDLIVTGGNLTSATSPAATRDLGAGAIVLSVPGGTIGTSTALPLEINAVNSLTASTGGGNAWISDLAGDLPVASVNVGAGNLTLTVPTGALIEASPSDALADLVSANMTLTANGIGTSTDRLEINATGTLKFTSSGYDVYLEDTAGGLQVNDSSVGTSNTIDLLVTGGNLTSATSPAATRDTGAPGISC